MSKRKADEIEEDEPTGFAEGDARKYFKEGQKFVTPINGDSTRGFYESLLKEKPNSHLAIRYCVENGLFSGEKHHALLKKYYELKSTGIFNPNRQALQRIAARTGEKIESPMKPIKRELPDTPASERKHKKHKKDKKKDKKEKKEKKKDKKDKRDD
jgi:hypothetical protein